MHVILVLSIARSLLCTLCGRLSYSFLEFNVLGVPLGGRASPFATLVFVYSLLLMK